MRKTDWDCCIGKNPNNYARRVLKECCIKEPPIDEHIVAEFLSATIDTITREEIEEFISGFGGTSHLPDFIENLKKSCAWLEKRSDGESIIHVLQDGNEQRMRLSVFHECGHEILPWHGQLDYICDDGKVHNHGVLVPFEKEAFQCGVELMMPGDVFLDDAMSDETSIETLSRLANRYNASLEATAIRYCSILKRDCAVMVIERSGGDLKVENDVSLQQDDIHLFEPSNYPSSRIDQTIHAPLVVKYFVKSSKFMGYARKGTGIGEENPIFDTWNSGEPFKGHMASKVWGSSKNISYHAECLRLGKTGKVLVLFWLPEKKLWLSFKEGMKDESSSLR